MSNPHEVNWQARYAEQVYQNLILKGEVHAWEQLAGRLHRAINEPGVNPDYHLRQVNSLRQNWPSLTLAIDLLLEGPK